MNRTNTTYDKRLKAACIALRLEHEPPVMYKEIMRRCREGELGAGIPKANPSRERITIWVNKVKRDKAVDRAKNGDESAFATMGAALLERLEKEVATLVKIPTGELNGHKAKALIQALNECRKLVAESGKTIAAIERVEEPATPAIDESEAELLAAIKSGK